MFKSLSDITKLCDKEQFLFGFLLNKIWCLRLSLTALICGKICLCSYPLCKSLFVNFCFIFRNSFSSEFVLRYLLTLPLLMTLIVVGGGMRMQGCIIVCWLFLCGFVHLGSDFYQIGHPYTGLCLGT